MTDNETRRPGQGTGAAMSMKHLKSLNESNGSADSGPRTRDRFLPAGPLATATAPPLSYLLEDRMRAAEWLVYVGLSGRYCFTDRWHQWLTGQWRPVRRERVVAEVRLVLQRTFDQLCQEPEADPVLVLRLLDLNWTLPILGSMRLFTQGVLGVERS